MRYIISFLIAIFPTFASAEVPNVITDIPPVHALVAQVMGDLGTPVLLLEKGADEHDFQLRPSQMTAIAQADLVIWVGPELTPWLEQALGNAKPGHISLALFDLKATIKLTGAGDQDAGHDHIAKEGADDPAAKESEHHDATEEKHHHDSADPHVWLDPGNAVIWLDTIAVELAKVDAQNAVMYQANATAAKARIAALDVELQALLEPVKDRPFVTFHDAYGYFVAHYGLTFAGSVAIGDASTPGAARLRALQETIAGGVVCAFPEVQHDPALLMQLLDGTQVRAGAAIDPVGSSMPAGPDAYDALMRALATHLADCLNGA